MEDDALHIAFLKAVNSVNKHAKPFPADVLLNLYAYYKRATNSQDSSADKEPLISAFKTNALFQTRNLTQDEAKQLYTETVDRYFLYRK